jgi:hypothetical protein
MAGIGRIHDVFHTTLDDLQTQAAAQASASHGKGTRPWQVPMAVTDVLDITGITQGFNRDIANANYEAIIASTKAGGTTGDVIAVKVQVDYVGVMERGFRARHCTAVRGFALALGRRNGHGQPKGIFGGGVGKYVQDALKAGQS